MKLLIMNSAIKSVKQMTAIDKKRLVYKPDKGSKSMDTKLSKFRQMIKNDVLNSF